MNISIITVLVVTTFYSEAHQGKTMANGHPFDKDAFTCASYLYPLGTELRVTYEGKTVQVIVTDRCDDKTQLDLSERAFEHIAPLDMGRIQAEVVFDLDSQTQAWKDEHGEAVDVPLFTECVFKL